MSASDKDTEFQTKTFGELWLFAARNKNGYQFEFDPQGYWTRELPNYKDEHLFNMLEGDFNRGTVAYGNRSVPIDAKAKKMRQLERQKRDLSMLQIEQLNAKQMQAAEETGKQLVAKQEEYDQLNDEPQEAVAPVITATAKDLLEGELSLTEKQARGFARSMQQSLFYFPRYLTNYLGEPEYSASVCREGNKLIIKLHTETDPEMSIEFKIRVSDLTDKKGEPQRARIELFSVKSKDSDSGYWSWDGYHYKDETKAKDFLSGKDLIVSAQNDPVRLEHNQLESRLKKLRAEHEKLSSRVKTNQVAGAFDRVLGHIESRMLEINDELEDNTKNRVLICKNKLPSSIQWDRNCVYLLRDGNNMVAYYYKGPKLITATRSVEDFNNFRDLHLNAEALEFTEKEELGKIGSFYGFNKGLTSKVDTVAEKLNQQAVTNPFLLLTDAQLAEALISTNETYGLDADDAEIREVEAAVPVKQSGRKDLVQSSEVSAAIQADTQKEVEKVQAVQRNVVELEHEEKKTAKVETAPVFGPINKPALQAKQAAAVSKNKSDAVAESLHLQGKTGETANLDSSSKESTANEFQRAWFGIVDAALELANNFILMQAMVFTMVKKISALSSPSTASSVEKPQEEKQASVKTEPLSAQPAGETKTTADSQNMFGMFAMIGAVGKMVMGAFALEAVNRSLAPSDDKIEPPTFGH